MVCAWTVNVKLHSSITPLLIYPHKHLSIQDASMLISSLIIQYHQSVHLVTSHNVLVLYRYIDV